MKRASSCRAALILAISLLSACNSERKGPVPDFVQSNVSWSECRAKAMMAGVRGRQSAEVLRDQVFDFCKNFEEKFLLAGLAEQGDQFQSSFTNLRAEYRRALLERIIEIRTGREPKNPFVAWGRCNGNKANAELGNADALEVRVERVLAACREFENTVRADAISKFGRDQGNQAVDDAMPELKRQIAQRLMSTR